MKTVPGRILVATDFSPTASRALELARVLAASFDAELHLLHVRVLLEDPHLAEEQRMTLREVFALGDDPSREALESASTDDRTPRVVPHLVRAISAAEAIVETAASAGCELIVMGTHGRRGLKHLLLGSVAEQVVRSAAVPVLTVRGDATIPTGFRRLLVPHDFSEHSARALDLAALWARRLGASILMLHAVEPVVYPDFYAVDVLPGELSDRLRTRSTEALEAVVRDSLEGLDASTRVTVARAGDAVVATAGDGECDLVVMGTRGLSAFEHLLLGSVAEGVVRRSPIPVLTVRGE